jgi:hypothetical protein
MDNAASNQDTTLNENNNKTRKRGRVAKALPDDNTYACHMQAFYSQRDRKPASTDKKDGAPNGFSWGSLISRFKNERGITADAALNMTADFSKVNAETLAKPKKSKLSHDEARDEWAREIRRPLSQRTL